MDTDDDDNDMQQHEHDEDQEENNETNVNALNISQNQSRHQKKHHQKNASQYLYYQIYPKRRCGNHQPRILLQLRFTPAFVGLNHLDRQLLYLVRI
jgi:ribosomal protein L4